jgi:nucleotide-binding universal stress UspA family protein
MELPLIAGVDGSESSLRAVDWASDEAVLRGLPLRVVYASLWARYEGAALAEDLGRPSQEVRAEDIAAGAARRARARHPGLEVLAEVVPEEPEYALVHQARNASALVMGSRGRSGIAELLLGSVSLTVAAHADCPVIVLRGGHDNRAVPGTRGRVVVGVGEHTEPSAAVRFAVDEARRRRVQLVAVRAWRWPAHESTDHPLMAGEPARLHEEQAAKVLQSALPDIPDEMDVQQRTVEGPAGKVLLAASHDADLLVVGARRRKDRFGLQLGRVTHTVLHHAACPVAVVPERA